jgi:aspartate kinase
MQAREDPAMKVVVQKFGGSSVADAEKVKNVAKIVLQEHAKGHDVVVAVSAMGKTTDNLIKLAREITDRPHPRELDMLLATGEQVSIACLAMAIQAAGVDAVSFTGPQVRMLTDEAHGRAKILDIDDMVIREALGNGKVVIVAGFQGMTPTGQITTLGRGGSDTTAVALAAALHADICDIYTDVEGVYTTDPRVVPEARKLDKISYDECLELAALGAKVLHSRSVEIAKKHRVPLQVRSTFAPDRLGTMIVEETPDMESILVSGVAFNRAEAKVNVLGVPDRPGIASELFAAIADANIIVDVILQNVAENGQNDIAFTVPRDDLRTTLEVVERVAKRIGAREVKHDDQVAKVSIVGVGMRSHSGVASRMFSALAREGINIQSISTSEIKISCLIDEKEVDRAVRVIHEEFELAKAN